MYLAFLDEADHTKKNSFTICGMTVVPIEKAKELSDAVQELRDEAGFFKNTDLLKSSTNSRPVGCSTDDFAQLKNGIMKLAHEHDAKFMAYCKFNSKKHPGEGITNSTFGFNTLLAVYGRYLERKQSFGLAQIDRFETPKGHEQYPTPHAYLIEKFQQGNWMSNPETWKPHSRIVSFSLSCEGTSHLTSVNDILTGAFRFVANGQSGSAKSVTDKVVDPKEEIMKVLPKVMWSGAGSFQEHGLTMRPKDKAKLQIDEAAEYDVLRANLNDLMPAK